MARECGRGGKTGKRDRHEDESLIMLSYIFRAYDEQIQDDQCMLGNTVTDEIKSKIDTELDKYPKLKELVNNSEKKYVIYAPYPYGSEYSEIEKKLNSTRDEREEICKRLLEYETDLESLPQLLEHVLKLAPWFDHADLLFSDMLLTETSLDAESRRKIQEIVMNPPLRKLKADTSRVALGGVLYYGGFEHTLEQVNHFLTIYPRLMEWNYTDKIYDEFFSMCSEMKVYDQLKKLGFDPEHEQEVPGTDSKPDFSINFNGTTYFIEVKCRFESFEEGASFMGMSEYISQTGFMSVDEPTRKTSRLVVTAILDQINKWESVAGDIPVILIIETRFDFLGTSLNVDIANLPQMICEYSKGNRSNIPYNLKGILIFNCNYEQSPNGVFYSLNNCDDGFTKKISSVLPWIKIFR